MKPYDAVIVGSGPNGLAAAITLAQTGYVVLVLEGHKTIGGGLRSDELTLPGFIHDVCSAFHPLGVGSPFFRNLLLEEHGLQWVHPPYPLAHPFEDGTAAVLSRSIKETAASLGQDARAYTRLMQPLLENMEGILQAFLGPLRLPKHPLAMLRFGLPALLPAKALAKVRFQGAQARGLFAGLAAHAFLPLEHPATAAFGLMLGLLGHSVGWPVVRGGSAGLAAALAAYLKSLGGEIVTGQFVRSLDNLPPARAVLLDLAPKGVLELVGDKLPLSYRRQLERYRYGPGVFKLDIALEGVIPWTAEACHRAGTVHVGGGLEEIALSEREAWQGRHAERPYMLVGQQSLWDTTRAPEGKSAVWAYCHVPHGSTLDMTQRMLRQLERFAPGTRERVLAVHSMNAVDFERYNPNYVGGDINAGVQDLRQLFTRPALRLDPYSTPLENVFICSSATPPGGGVHGMCGYFAAQSVLKRALK